MSCFLRHGDTHETSTEPHRYLGAQPSDLMHTEPTCLPFSGWGWRSGDRFLPFPWAYCPNPWFTGNSQVYCSLYTRTHLVPGLECTRGLSPLIPPPNAWGHCQPRVKVAAFMSHTEALWDMHTQL